MLSWCTGSPSAKLELSKDVSVKAELASASKSSELPQPLLTTPARVAAMHGQWLAL